jgi:trigger factor
MKKSFFNIAKQKNLTVNITKQETAPLQATISITAGPEDYFGKVQEGIKKLSKTATIKGFRKGMVPVPLIKKMYGASLMYDELNKAVINSLYEYLQENKIDIIANPIPLSQVDDLDINNPQSYTLDFEIGIAPHIDIDKYINKDFSVNESDIQVNDDLLEKEMDNLRSRHGEVSNPENFSSDNDFFECTLTEKDKENGLTQSAFINFKMIKDEKLKEEILGMKVGDMLTINIFEAMDKSREDVLKFILKADEHAEVGDTFDMTITKITSYGKSELNQEFFDKAFGEGKVSTEEEAKTLISGELKEYLNGLAKNDTNNKIFKALKDKLDFQLPEQFLQKMVKEEKGIEDFNAFLSDYRWMLLLENLKKNALHVDRAEIAAHSKAELAKMFAQYNPTGTGLDEATLDMFNENMLKKEDHAKKSYEAVLEHKLFDYLRDKITIVQEAVSFDDFINKDKK